MSEHAETGPAAVARALLAGLWWAALGVTAALVPAPARDRLAVRHGLSLPLWSLVVGAVEGVTGLLLYLDGALGFVAGVTDERLSLLVEEGSKLPTGTHANISAGGLADWMAWHLEPRAWLFIMLALTGLARGIAFFATHQPIAEPVLVAAWRLAAWSGAGKRAAARRLTFGPSRPDRFVREPGADLVLLCARRKPEWDELVTIKIGARFYRVAGVEERTEERWSVIAYKLEELDETDPIRRLIHYGDSLGDPRA